MGLGKNLSIIALSLLTSCASFKNSNLGEILFLQKSPPNVIIAGYDTDKDNYEDLRYYYEVLKVEGV